MQHFRVPFFWSPTWPFKARYGPIVFIYHRGSWDPSPATPHQRLSLIKKYDLFMYFHVNSNLKTSASEIISIFNFRIHMKKKGLALKQKYRFEIILFT